MYKNGVRVIMCSVAKKALTDKQTKQTNKQTKKVFRKRRKKRDRKKYIPAFTLLREREIYKQILYTPKHIHEKKN